MANVKTVAVHQPRKRSRVPKRALASKSAPRGSGPGTGRRPERSRPKRPCNSKFSIGTDTYTITVGGQATLEKKDFTIHTSVAFKASDLLRRWLELGLTEVKGDEFVDDNTGHLTLPTISIHAFGFVVEFLYKDSINTSDRRNPDLHTLIDLWKVADYLEMGKLQNFVMEDLRGQDIKTRWPMATIYDSISHCYDGTKRDSPLRVWITQLFASGEARFDKAFLTDGEIRAYGCEDFWFDCMIWGGNE